MASAKQKTEGRISRRDNARPIACGLSQVRKSRRQADSLSAGSDGRMVPLESGGPGRTDWKAQAAPRSLSPPPRTCAPRFFLLPPKSIAFNGNRKELAGARDNCGAPSWGGKALYTPAAKYQASTAKPGGRDPKANLPDQSRTAADRNECKQLLHSASSIYSEESLSWRARRARATWTLTHGFLPSSSNISFRSGIASSAPCMCSTAFTAHQR